MNIFKNEKTRKRNLLLCIVPFVLIIGFLVFLSLDTFLGLLPGNESMNEYKDEFVIQEYNYRLRDNATEYQIELFDELKSALESGDRLMCAESIVKNYIADFYTWTNKTGSYDVGGVYYMYSPYHYLTSFDARRNFYKYLTYYIKTYGREALLEVTDIRVLSSVERDYKYDVEGESYDLFYIECEWDYNDYTFDKKTKYAKKGYFDVIRTETGRYEIVETWGDD